MTFLLWLGLLGMGMGLRLARQPLVSPASVMVATWLFVASVLILTGDHYFPISAKTVLIYLSGLLSFVIGALLGQRGARPSPGWAPRRIPEVSPILWSLVLLLMLMLPVYLFAVGQFVGSFDPVTFLAAARRADLEGTESGEHMGPIRNLAVLAHVVAVIAVFERHNGAHSRGRMILAICLALVYLLALGTKGNVIKLALTLVFALALTRARFPIREGVAMLVAALLVFAVGAIFVNFAHTVPGGGLSGQEALWLVTDYLVGGVVAFDRVVQHPSYFEPVQTTLRFFLETGRSLGVDFVVPSQHARFVMISGSADGNVFTVFFSYFLDGGLFYVIFGLAVVGYSCGLLVRLWFHGGFVAGLLLAFLLQAAALSVFSEGFLLRLNQNLKVIFVGIFVYYLMPLLLRSWSVRRHGGNFDARRCIY